MKKPLKDVSAALEEIGRTCPFNQFKAYLAQEHPSTPQDPKLGGDCIEMNRRLIQCLNGIPDLEEIRTLKCIDNYHVITLFSYQGTIYMLDPFTQQKYPIELQKDKSTFSPAYPSVEELSNTVYLDFIEKHREFYISKKEPQRENGAIIGKFRLNQQHMFVDINTYNPLERLYSQQAVLFRVATTSGENITIQLPQGATSALDLTITTSKRPRSDAISIRSVTAFEPLLNLAADQLELDPHTIADHVKTASTIAIRYHNRSPLQKRTIPRTIDNQVL